jgi:Nucleotide-diphospho-sugar transferase
MIKDKSYTSSAEEETPTGSRRSAYVIYWRMGICIFCSLNLLGYFRNVDFSHHNLMARELQSAFGVVGIMAKNKGAQTQYSSLCQKIHEAQDIFEPANEPGRKMAHAFVANSGHLPLLRNSLVSIQQLSTPWKSFVLALDDKVCPDLYQQSPNLKVVCIPYGPRVLRQMRRDEPVFYNAYLNKTGEEVLLNETATWSSDMHKVLINSKLYGLRDVLHCGLDVFLTDVDIVFLKDPRPYFTGEDIIAQNDTNLAPYKLNMNSGFMYWRHTLQNQNLSQSLIKDSAWWDIDQTRVNELLWKRGINVTILNTTQFPNGAVLAGLKNLNDSVAVHANWNDHFDRKKEILTGHGLWLIK